MSNKISKTTSVFVGLTTAVMMSGALAFMPAVAHGQTVAELQAQIASLLEMISTLQAQLTGLQGGTPATCGYTFATNLDMGDTGTDVMNLQKVLNSDPVTMVASTGVGSAGMETEFFGTLTKSAVVKFQDKYASEVLTPIGLSAGTGYVGTMTRTKLNALYGVCVGEEPVTPVEPGEEPVVVPGTGLTITTVDQPTATLAVGGAARLPYTKFKLTAGSDGPVTVTGIVVERTGLARDAAFAGLILLDEDEQQLGIAKTLNSVHQTTVGEAVTIPAGESKTFTVAGNMVARATLASYAGEVGYISVVGVNTTADVTGELPITGAGHTVNGTLVIGSASVARAALDPNTSATKEIGTNDYTFSAIRVTAGSTEKIKLHSIRWNQSGSVGSADLESVMTYVDGVAYDAVASADGKYFTTTFDGGIVIDKGLSKDVYVKANIVDGSGRTAIFDIYKSTDFYVTGETYGYGVTGSAGSTADASDASAQFTTGTPWYDGAAVTVSAGSMTSVSKSPTVAAQNVSENVPNQPLGGYEVEIKGEAISVASSVFNFQITGTAGQVADITNISLYDENGAVVAGPVDGSGAAVSGTATFTETITYPIGKHVYQLKGTLGTDFSNNQTVIASTTPSSDWTTVRGLSTGDTISLSGLSTAATMNTMTLKVATSTVTVSTDPLSQNVVKGLAGFTFANYQFDASASGEDIKLTSGQFTIETDTGDTAVYPTACYAYDGATRLNNTAVNPTADGAQTFTFDNNLIIPKGTVKVVTLKCDIPASLATSNTIEWKLTNAATMAGTGLGSGQAITLTHNDSTDNQNKMTLVAGGTLALAKDPSSPSYSIVSAGSTGVTLGVFKFTSTNEEINLTKLGLELTNVASSSVSDLSQVTLWDGATQIGSGIFTSASTTITLSGDFIIPKDGDKVMTVKGDLTEIGTSKVGTQGHLIAVNAYASWAQTEGVGLSSGTTINSTSATTSVDGVRMMRSFPVFAKLAVPSTTLTSSTMDLYRFKVTADGADDIGIYKFTVNIATSSTPANTSTTSVTNLKIMAYTDSAYSSPVPGFSPAGQLNDTADHAGLLSSGNAEVLFSASTQGQDYLQIPAGTTYYFKVSADVTLTGGGTAGTVVTNIQGDAAYPELSTFMATASGVDDENGGHDDFIWSPNATTTSAAAHVDWTNGYFVQGLPATNMDAVTIAK